MLPYQLFITYLILVSVLVVATDNAQENCYCTREELLRVLADGTLHTPVGTLDHVYYTPHPSLNIPILPSGEKSPLHIFNNGICPCHIHKTVGSFSTEARSSITFYPWVAPADDSEYSRFHALAKARHHGPRITAAQAFLVIIGLLKYLAA
jgi:hypothetical protein